MGGAIAGGKAWPTPGVSGTGLGIQNQAMQAMPALQPNFRQASSFAATQPLKAIQPSMGKNLMPGQPAFPTGQTPVNPWGVGRGGSGTIAVSKRPGTLPGTKNLGV